MEGDLKNESGDNTQDTSKSKPKRKKEKTFLRTVRTYKDDIAQAMRTKKASLVSIAAAENERRAKDEKSGINSSVSQKQHLKKIGIIILSTILVLLGAGSAFYFYGKIDTGIVEPKPKISSIVFSEEEKEFEITNLSRRQILNGLTEMKNLTRLSLGTIKNVFITESFIDKEGIERRGLIDASDFLNAINVNLPTTFMRSLKPAFMLGVHMFNGNQPFLILKTSFYENAFTGMFEWETDMKEDLAPLFGPASFDIISDEDFGTSTAPFVIPIFSDFVVKNKDTRILKDNTGKTVLIYSFIDKNTIAITTNENTFSEIVTRLTSSRILR